MEHFLSANPYLLLETKKGTSIHQCCEEAAKIVDSMKVNVMFFFNDIPIQMDQGKPIDYMEYVRYYCEAIDYGKKGKK